MDSIRVCDLPESSFVEWGKNWLFLYDFFSKRINMSKIITVKVMIMSRYRFGPYVTDRYRFRANVTQRDINVTDRYWLLLAVTEFYCYFRYKRYRS